MGRAETNGKTLQGEPSGAGLRDESGQVLAEYALILVFVSLVALALTPLGPTLASIFNQVAGELAAAL